MCFSISFSKLKLAHGRIWSICHLPWFSQVIPSVNCFSKCCFNSWLVHPRYSCVRLLLRRPRFFKAEIKRPRTRNVKYWSELQFLHCVFTLSWIQMDPPLHSLHRLLFLLCSHIPPPLHCLHWLLAIMCSHIWLPIHSLQTHFVRLCSHKLFPSHFLQIFRRLLCSQIPIPQHSLHLCLILLCSQIWDPPHSTHSALFLLCSHFNLLFQITTRPFNMYLLPFTRCAFGGNGGGNSPSIGIVSQFVFKLFATRKVRRRIPAFDDERWDAPFVFQKSRG